MRIKFKYHDNNSNIFATVCATGILETSSDGNSALL